VNTDEGLRCPECSSNRLYRAGKRYRADGSEVQRWLCRDCDYRFSDPKVKLNVTGKLNEAFDARSDLLKTKISDRDLAINETFDDSPLPFSENVGSHELTVAGKDLNAFSRHNSERQLCASEKAKKLGTATEIKTVAGDYLNEEVKGLLAQFMAWLEKEGYPKETRYANNLKTLVRIGANLLDPENVKQVIGRHKVKNGTKLQYVHAYSAFAKMLQFTWDRPRYKQEETLPFVPDERELDQLIAACRSRRMTAFLQVLKETWVDPGEALGLRWIDISGSRVTINKPVKGHLPRQLEISNRLVAMLNDLPKKSERIFPTAYRNMFSCYDRVRRRAAAMQKNPRLLSIELRTFRHWGGSMLAYYLNGNVVKVQRLLGHKRIENTMKYIGMINIKDDEFEVAVATTDEEIRKLGTAGYQKYDERKMGEMCISYYRRPKRFSAYGS
jgi:integrase